ncbi:hypothetical protein O181_065066 [Austropuccinia psidii MF-1]|uniref:GID complex catalytic subunit 2 n=1 Tax=Austropuccinia psidii MF-1 TaxID=1389203 RepID=A0A9Q3EUY3_9BASI|nr:hypothetical protein [Austropuccinia psidii MF-1]
MCFCLHSECVNSLKSWFQYNHDGIYDSSLFTKLYQSFPSIPTMQALLRDWERAAAKANKNFQDLVDGLDRGILDLESLKNSVDRDGLQAVPGNLESILHDSEAISKSSAHSHKEFHSYYSKFQKVVDKKFNQTVLPLLGPNLVPTQTEALKPKRPFESDSAQKALHRVITTHLLRQGRFETARIFAQEVNYPLPSHELQSCRELYGIINLVKAGDLTLALEWAQTHRLWLNSRDSPLEFDLRRSQFIRLLTQPDFTSLVTSNKMDEVEMDVESEPEDDRMMDSVTLEQPQPHPSRPESDHSKPFITQSHSISKNSSSKAFSDLNITSQHVKARQEALSYARQHFTQFFPKRWDEAVKLVASTLYIPLCKLKRSPYAELFQSFHGNNGQPWVHADHLVPLFTKEYYAQLEWSKELPLKIATDLGSGGALAKIAKVRSVMKEKRTEWSQADELPVEIPLPTEYRFHSVFACPVSKEQSTESNPPMMMPCGHVIAKESMQKLAKGGGTVKCPYCPSSASMNSAIQVYF